MRGFFRDIGLNSDFENRLNALEGNYDAYEWFAEISSGTTGTLTVPTGGTFVMDSWAEDVDAVVSTISTGTPPDIEHAREADGTIVTTTFTTGGAYTLSGTPSSYPVAIIYRYQVKPNDLDPDKILNTVKLADGDIAYDTIVLPAGAMIPATTSPAETGTNEYATNDLDRDYFAFDGGATEERVAFGFFMPDDWDAGTVRAKFIWSSATASTSGDTVEWGFKAVASLDSSAIDAAKGTPQVITDTLLADNGADNQITSTTPAMTIAGSPVAGSWVDFEIYRNTDGTDDMAEDAWLFGVKIQYSKDSTQAAW